MDNILIWQLKVTLVTWNTVGEIILGRLMQGAIGKCSVGGWALFHYCNSCCLACSRRYIRVTWVV